MNDATKRVDTIRPDWDSMFLLDALYWSRRSHDAQTQCGCVIVKDKTILSVGYNGFIREVDDSALPNIRPLKYPFMMHAEQNAIFNCARNGISTLNSTAYITSKPCTNCLQYMYQSGVCKVIYSNFSNPVKTNEDTQRFELLLDLLSYRMRTKFIDKSKIYTKHLQDIMDIVNEKEKDN